MCNYKMAGKKRKSDQMEVLTRPKLLEAIGHIEKDRDRALAAFLYLTGMRISELLGTTKIIKIYTGKGKEKVLVNKKEVTIEPLVKESIEIIPDKDRILIHQVACLKKQGSIPKRTIPIRISRENEFLAMFLGYYNSLPAGSKLFNINRHRAWQIINKELGMYNHFLIHERCTHLVTSRGFTDLDLMRFRGWTDTKPAAIYAHLNYEDILNKM